MSDMYLGSQLPMYQNVRLRVFNKDTGEVRIERTAKNRVTRLMLWGIARFLSGEFNNSTPDKIYEYIPRFIGLGSNKPTTESQLSGVTTTVTVNDTRLLNEHTISTSTGRSEPVKRIDIQGRQHNKTSTSFSDSFIKLSLSVYINSSVYNNLEIGEAGLFSKERDNNCLARVVFAPFTKHENEVIDIQWDITLLSYGITRYPESVLIEGPTKVTIPLQYTPYHIVTHDIGLYYDRDTKVLHTKDGTTIFSLTPEGNIVEAQRNYTDADVVASGWEEYVKGLNDPHCQTLKAIYDVLQHSQLRDNNQFYFTSNSLNSQDADMPTHFYLGEAKVFSGRENLLVDSEMSLLEDKEGNLLSSSDPIAAASYSQSVCLSYIYRDDNVYNDVLMGYRVIDDDMGTHQIIVDADNKPTKYLVMNNEIYVKNEFSDSGYTSTRYYISDGYIIKESRERTEYKVDSDGYIVQEVLDVEASTIVPLEAFLVWKDNYMQDLSIYRTNSYGSIVDTRYWIDWDSDKEVYKTELSGDIKDTLFHITTAYNPSDDAYFAMGDTHKLSAIISPSDATDKSVTWSIVNDAISKINSFGVLHAWNLGETLAYVKTTNDVRARVTVEVVRNTAIVNTTNIVLDPEVLAFDITGDIGVYKTIKAYVYPATSSYTTINWTLDNDANKIVVFESLNNNEVRIKIKGTDIGRGYITANTLDGISAKCLIQVSTTSDNNIDCEDDSHDTK